MVWQLMSPFAILTQMAKSDKEDWHLMADAAKNEGACVEPRAMAPTWIHMDWRGTCPNGW